MPSPLPPFEKDSTTLSILWNVYCQDMESQKLTTIKMEANKKLYEDWKTTADRLNKILGSYGISKTSSFSKTTQKHLSLLAELADVLDIGDGKTTSYYKAILRLQSDKRKSENDFQSIMTSIDRLKSKREELSVEFEKLNRLTQKLRLRADEDEQSIKEYRRNFTMLQYKESEYKDKLTRLEETYSAHPIHTHSLRYPHLLSLQNTVSEAQSRLSNDKNKLHSFNGLPPDLDLARLKVLEASKQLEELKNVRDELLEGMVKTVIEDN
ncbi:hypothetical protein BKA69DRAFT_148311 [Paraphysoderma sedebokerense]|nr:hypothetical protein BKA69DRAFT_148311 [Paraphysoderma sedebokerense]